MTKTAFRKLWASAKNYPVLEARCPACRQTVRVGEQCCHGETLKAARRIPGTRAGVVSKWEQVLNPEVVGL